MQSDFQTTKIGDFPADWLVVPIGKVITLSQYGLSIASSENGNVPILGMKDLANGKISLNNLARVLIDEEDLEKFRLEPNDILLNRTNSYELVGKVSIYDSCEVVVFASYLVRFQFDQRKIVPKFANYFLNSYPAQCYLKKIATRGVSQVNINPTVFRKLLPIPVPPITEQKRIVEILEAWDGAIAIVERLITAKQKLKKAFVQKVLKGNLEFPESDSSKWQILKIKNVAEINPRLSADLSRGSLATFLGMADVQEGGGILSPGLFTYEGSSNGYTSFQENDILIAKITPCFENYKGALAENLENGIGFGSTEFHVLRCGEQIKPEFLYQITLSYEFRGKGKSNMIGSAGQKRVPVTFLKNHPISLPSLEEQTKICELFKTLDAEISNLSALKDKLDAQKRGLMQKLLTGEWPVPVEAEVAA